MSIAGSGLVQGAHFLDGHDKRDSFGHDKRDPELVAEDPLEDVLLEVHI